MRIFGDISRHCEAFTASMRAVVEKHALLTMYWGHPYIDYIGGPEALFENVTMPKEIDDE